MYLPDRRDIIRVLPYSSSSSFGNTTLPYITQIQPHHPRHSQVLSQATIAVLCLGLIIAVALCLVLLRVLALQRRDTTGSLRGLPLSTRLSKALGIGSNRRNDRMDRSDSGSLISESQERSGLTLTTSTSLPLHKRKRTTEGQGNIFSRRLVSRFGSISVSRKKNTKHRKNSSSFNSNEIKTTLIPSSWLYETSSHPVILPMTRMEGSDPITRDTLNQSQNHHHQPSSSNNGSGSNSSGTVSLHSHSNSTSSYRNGSIPSPSNTSGFSSISVFESHSINGFRTTPPQSPMRALYSNSARRGSNFSSTEGVQVVRRESVALAQAWKEVEKEYEAQEPRGYRMNDDSIFVIEDSFPTPQAQDYEGFSFQAQAPQQPSNFDPSASPKSSRPPLTSHNNPVPRLAASESFQRLVATDQSYGYVKPESVEDSYRRPSQPVSAFTGYSMSTETSNKPVGNGVWNWPGVSESVSEERRGSAATSTTIHHSSSRRPSWLDGYSHSNPNSSAIFQSLRRPSAGPLPTPDQVHFHAPGQALHHHMHLQGLSQPLPPTVPPVLRKVADLATASSKSIVNTSSSLNPSSPLTSMPISAPASVSHSDASHSTLSLRSGEELQSRPSPSTEAAEEDFEDSTMALTRFRGRVPMLRSASDAPSALSLPRTVSRAGSLDFESENDEALCPGSDWEEEVMSDDAEGEDFDRELKTSSSDSVNIDRTTLPDPSSNTESSQVQLQSKSSFESILGLNNLNASPTASARLRALARPPALLPASLTSNQNKIGIRLNGKENLNLDDPDEYWDDESTPRYSRFSIRSGSNGDLPSPTQSLAPTLIESSSSNPNTPTSPNLPLTPSNKVNPLPTLEEHGKTLHTVSHHHHQLLKKNNIHSKNRFVRTEVENDGGDDMDLQGAFKESFMLDVGNGRAVKLAAMPTPSLEKANPIGWL